MIALAHPFAFYAGLFVAGAAYNWTAWRISRARDEIDAAWGGGLFLFEGLIVVAAVAALFFTWAV